MQWKKNNSTHFTEINSKNYNIQNQNISYKNQSHLFSNFIEPDLNSKEI